MAKKVEYEGKKYKITFGSYGFSNCRLFVNGEGSGITPYNSVLTNIDLFKEYAKKAIIEYEDRQRTRKIFKNWDGKL